jgi:hypothetical protein
VPASSILKNLSIYSDKPGQDQIQDWANLSISTNQILGERRKEEEAWDSLRRSFCTRCPHGDYAAQNIRSILSN